jgi:soluble lytic murein transglycosylase-like protein
LAGPRYNLLKNIAMMICLAAAPAPALASGAVHRTVEVPRSVVTTVRADSRSGRLVRTAAAPPRQAAARSGGAARPEETARVDLGAIIESVAATYGVDPLLVHSVIEVESNYNPVAVSPKGAQGLMQLIPATARRFGAGDSFNVAQNIEAGVRYLKYLHGLFGENHLALAAYNAGEGAVLKYRNVPPYRETERYVHRVGRKYGEAKRASGRARPPVQAAEPPVAAARPVEGFVDAAGRIHLRTR